MSYAPGPVISPRFGPGRPHMGRPPMNEYQPVLREDQRPIGLIPREVPLYPGSYYKTGSPPYLKIALLWPLYLPQLVLQNYQDNYSIMVPLLNAAVGFGIYRYMAGSWRLPVSAADFAKTYGSAALGVYATMALAEPNFVDVSKK